MSNDISSSADIIDVRDIIARVEELRSERGDLQTYIEEADEALDGTLEAADAKQAAIKDAADWANDYAEELETLESLLDDLCGYGGDEQWEGDWYPLTLVNESYFVDFAQEEAESCDLIKKDARWPNNHIDWEAAAEELKQDYSTVDYDGTTFYYR